MRKYIDRKLFYILLGYMAAYHVVYISRHLILKLSGREEYADTSWYSLVLEPTLANFIIVPPIILLVIVVTRYMIYHNFKWIYALIVHFILSLVYASLITIFNSIYGYFIFKEPLNVIFENLFVRTLFASNLNFLGYVGFVTISYSYYYIRRTASAETQKAQLAEQLQNAKMDALKSQLNPHFLFNTLNSISSLIKEDAYKAQHMIGTLGGLLREVLLVQHENLIPMHKEILILKKYLEIMQIRFSDHLSIHLDIDKNVENKLVPTMLLQPIIENALKYGYSYDNTNLKIVLSAYERDTKLVIEVKNNGALLPDEGIVEGTGIQNVRQRLEALFDEDFEFSFSNLEADNGVVVSIKIPLGEPA